MKLVNDKVYREINVLTMVQIKMYAGNYTNDVVDNLRSNKYKIHFYYVTVQHILFVNHYRSPNNNVMILFTSHAESLKCLKLYLHKKPWVFFISLRD